jgi:glyoxylase-like metal-dependent hydrolase (beta-lactamase superfamily II)
MKIRLVVLTMGVLFCAAMAITHAQNPPAPVPSTVEKIKDDLYVLKGEGGNTTVYVTGEGVILVDVKFERNHDDIVAKVKTLTDRPIRYVFNSHWHGDHTGGNEKMLPTAQIVGHRNARADMVKGKAPGLPQLTYSDQIAVNLGGKEAVAYNFGSCHTNGDTFVYFPAAKVLAAGDCFNTGNGQGLNPTGSSTFGFYIDYNSGGSFAGREKTADALLKLDFETVVPGHGPMTNKAGFARWRQDIAAIRNRVSTMLREGKSKDDIGKMLVTDFGWDPMGNAMLRSLDGIMAELK